MLSPIDGTPVAGAMPFVVLGFREIRDTLVSKRMLLGWSQAFLASQCPDPSAPGVTMHHNTVYKFEKYGWRGPQDLTVAARLAEAMGLELALAVREAPNASVVARASGHIGPRDGGSRARVPASVREAQALLEPAQPRAVAAEARSSAESDPDLEF